MALPLGGAIRNNRPIELCDPSTANGFGEITLVRCRQRRRRYLARRLSLAQYILPRMDIDWIRDLCLSLPGATEQILWGNDLVFKVGGKMFAAAALEPGPVCLSFKCSDEDFAELD